MNQVNSDVVSIDPGANGGIAIFRDSVLLATHRMPTVVLNKKKVSDVIEIVSLIEESLGELVVKSNPSVILEIPYVMPGLSIAYGLTIGHSYGRIDGALTSYKLDMHYVWPQQWQKKIFGRKYKGKETTMCWCCENFPNADLIGSSRANAKIHDGICDAIAIGYSHIEKGGSK